MNSAPLMSQPVLFALKINVFSIKPFINTSTGKHAVAFSSPHIWNSIPHGIRSKLTINSFKSHLKTFCWIVISLLLCCPPGDYLHVSGPYPEMWSGGRVPRKILAFSPSKWCIWMHSGARFRPTRQKGRPRNFCVDFSGGGGFNPRNPPLNTGLAPLLHMRQLPLYKMQPRRLWRVGNVWLAHASHSVMLWCCMACRHYFSGAHV